MAFGLGYFSHSVENGSDLSQSQMSVIGSKQDKTKTIKLGAFSMSLSVRNLALSKAFYETLGFTVLGGSMEKNYLILKNGNALLGIFQGMFEGHMLTFNPSWDESGKNVEKFDDIREIQKHLKKNEIALSLEADETTTGPASFMLTDPDGNILLIDQHR
jgi:catechol 2,3-dioxygenase-like lactoylglutathione lyase family enzyme